MDGTDGTEQVPYTRVTVAEAAERLGVSVVTIRRMIKSGRLEAERVHRPQGSAYLVTLPMDGTADGTPTERPAQNVSRTQGTPADAMAAWAASVLTPILAPIAAELTASRQQLVAQAETIGRQAAELERAASAIVGLGNELEALRSDRRAPWRYAWWICAAIIAFVVMAVVLQTPIAR
jgi:excisionase family DNA binding protein